MSMTLQVHKGWLAITSPLPPGPELIFYDPEMRLATERDDREFAERFATLTVREEEILRLRAQGLTNAEIAHRCFLSEQTVKNQLNHAMRTLVFDGIDATAKLNRALYLLGRYEACEARR